MTPSSLAARRPLDLCLRVGGSARRQTTARDDQQAADAPAAVLLLGFVEAGVPVSAPVRSRVGHGASVATREAARGAACKCGGGDGRASRGLRAGRTQRSSRSITGRGLGLRRHCQAPSVVARRGELGRAWSQGRRKEVCRCGGPLPRPPRREHEPRHQGAHERPRHRAATSGWRQTPARGPPHRTRAIDPSGRGARIRGAAPTAGRAWPRDAAATHSRRDRTRGMPPPPAGTRAPARPVEREARVVRRRVVRFHGGRPRCLRLREVLQCERPVRVGHGRAGT